MMVFVIIALFILLLFLLVVYNGLEITLFKYGVLRAMATHSKEVDSALHEFLKTKDDFKIRNKDYKKFEHIYLSSLNNYILQFNGADNQTIRRAILNNKNIES